MIAQASAIPYRQFDNRIEFCLITSLNSGKWGFPKGIIDPGESPEETALKEAFEEAGVEGTIVGEPLGSYEYDKRDTTLTVMTFLMEVTRCNEHWDECDVRERWWVTAEEAPQLLSRSHLLRLLTVALERLNEALSCESEAD